MLRRWKPVESIDALGGDGVIAGEMSGDPEVQDGLLTVNGVPASRQIEVRERKTRRVVAVRHSQADGTYRFPGLNPTLQYDVIARDFAGDYEDVIAGAVRPHTPDLLVPVAAGDKMAAFSDPYGPDVVSLLHFDGADNGTTFTDETGRAWAAIGSAKTEASLKKWGTAAGDFNGVDAYIRTPHSSDLNVGSKDYTVEAWVYLRAAIAYVIFASKGNSAVIQLPVLLSMDGSGTKVQFGVGIGGGWKIAVSGAALPLNEWVHIAGVRSGGSLLLFQQGVLVGTAAAIGAAMDNTSPLTIGANEPGNAFANVVVDDFRFTVGVARYTANFTPPTAPFEL